MKYRELGRMGLKVSEIGMGCEGFVDKSYVQVKEFVDVMEEGGVNCTRPTRICGPIWDARFGDGGSDSSFRLICAQSGMTDNINVRAISNR